MTKIIILFLITVFSANTIYGSILYNFSNLTSGNVGILDQKSGYIPYIKYNSPKYYKETKEQKTVSISLEMEITKDSLSHNIKDTEICITFDHDNKLRFFPEINVENSTFHIQFFLPKHLIKKTVISFSCQVNYFEQKFIIPLKEVPELPSFMLATEN